MGNKIIIICGVFFLIWNMNVVVLAKDSSKKRNYPAEWQQKKREWTKNERKYFCGYSYNKKKIWIIVKTEIFYKKNFKLTPCDPKYGTVKFCLINNKVPFGSTLSEMPVTYLDKLKIKIGDKVHTLNSFDMYNTLDYVRSDDYVCRQDKSGMYRRNFTLLCGDEDNCTIRGRFGDAAGSYAAEWNIDYGVSTRNVITNDYDILHLFDKEKLPLYDD